MGTNEFPRRLPRVPCYLLGVFRKSQTKFEVVIFGLLLLLLLLLLGCDL